MSLRAHHTKFVTKNVVICYVMGSKSSINRTKNLISGVLSFLALFI